MSNISVRWKSLLTAPAVVWAALLVSGAATTLVAPGGKRG
jgi:hypothetical protein